jgi:hypothetical protein
MKSLQRKGNHSHFWSKITNGRVLRAVVLVSTLNTAGAMFCALHAVIRTFKRRTVTNGKEITVIFCPNRRMVPFCELLDWFRRLIERAMFCAWNAVIWAFKRRNISNGTEITVIFLQNRRTIACYELLAGFDALYSVHYVIRLKCSELGVCTMKSLQREGNSSHFSSKSTNGRVLRVVGLVSTHNRACTMFCAWNAVIWAFIRRNSSNG